MNNFNALLVNYLGMYIVLLALILMSGCKSQSNHGYQAADRPKPDGIEKLTQISPIQTPVSKGAIRLKTMVTKVEAKQVTAKVIAIRGLGPNFASVAPAEGSVMELSNRAAYKIKEGKEYVMEVLMSREDNKRGNLLKVLGESESDQY